MNNAITFKKSTSLLRDSTWSKATLKRFPVEPGNYITGNEYSPVAVVIPRGNHDLLRTAIESGAAIAGHLVTANIGIEKLIANVVSNPNIRYLVIFGRESDGHLAARSLICLQENGVDESGRIIGSEGMTPYIRNLPREAVERFRRQIVHIIDLLNEEEPSVLKKVVAACIQEPENAVELNIGDRNYVLYDPGALREEPMIVTITERMKYSGVYETLSPYSTVIDASTISAAYPLFVEAILSAGHDVADERGSETKELLNVQVHILEPSRNPIPSGYRPEGWLKTDEDVQKYLDAYVKTYFQPNSVVVYEDGRILLKKGQVRYTYGDRITNFGGINQLDTLVEAVAAAIRKNHQSRRFVISLFDPRIDLALDTEDMEIPCFTQFWIYNRREGDVWTLHGTMFLRSHDAHSAFPANSYAGMRILEHVCTKTGSEIGTLTMYFGSAHIYLE